MKGEPIIMSIFLNHIALNVKDFDWYEHFFRTVCSMNSYREDGVSPNRKIWFSEGIQLNETTEELPVKGIYDHVGFHAEDAAGFVSAAKAAGCSDVPGKAHWFMLPNGVKVEVKCYS